MAWVCDFGLRHDLLGLFLVSPGFCAYRPVILAANPCLTWISLANLWAGSNGLLPLTTGSLVCGQHLTSQRIQLTRISYLRLWHDCHRPVLVGVGFRNIRKHFVSAKPSLNWIFTSSLWCVLFGFLFVCAGSCATGVGVVSTQLCSLGACLVGLWLGSSWLLVVSSGLYFAGIVDVSA